MDWLDEIMNGNATPTEEKVTVPAPRRERRIGLPTHPNEWGSGGKSNPLPGEEPPASTASGSASGPASRPSENTPEEVAELGKRKEAKKEAVLPPKPSAPPTVHEKQGEEEAPQEAPEDEEKESLSVRLKSAVGKAKAKSVEVKGKVYKRADLLPKEGEEQPGEGAEKAEGGAGKTGEGAPENDGKRWSLLWAGAASWIVSPGTLAALYDHTIPVFGSWTENFPRADYLNSGGVPHEWDLLEGPAWWVRNTVQAAFESGATQDLFVAGLVGLIPTISLVSFNHRIVRFFTVIGAAYFIGFEWFPHWWEVYMATMAACAYYGWTMANRIRSGFLACMLRIPMAALVSGSLLYSPGAIF